MASSSNQLIIISGYPSSGKTYRARQIANYFERRIASRTAESNDGSSNNSSKSENSKDNNGKIESDNQIPSNPVTATTRLKVHHISDDTLGIPRSAYRDARTEKTARASFYSAVKRLLGPEDVVIADGMNYIKGFRYQMHCEAKAVETGCCVVSYVVFREPLQ